MAEFMMLMKGSGKADTTTDCTITEFMRFEADSKEQVLNLLPGNRGT